MTLKINKPQACRSSQCSRRIPFSLLKESRLASSLTISCKALEGQESCKISSTQKRLKNCQNAPLSLIFQITVASSQVTKGSYLHRVMEKLKVHWTNLQSSLSMQSKWTRSSRLCKIRPPSKLSMKGLRKSVLLNQLFTRHQHPSQNQRRLLEVSSLRHILKGKTEPERKGKEWERLLSAVTQVTVREMAQEIKDTTPLWDRVALRVRRRLFALEPLLCLRERTSWSPQSLWIKTLEYHCS